MNKIIFPDNLNVEYEETIRLNPDVIFNGFYYGPHDEAYKQGRMKLSNSSELIYTCDYWLDGYCWQDNNSFYHVRDTIILHHIHKKYNQFCIPLGCLIIAVKHRKEDHIMSSDSKGFDLIVNKKAYLEYVELNK